MSEGAVALATPSVRQWFGVELRHLVALAAVHEQRSFRGAAEQLGYVQSAVSQQIAALERLVGLRLVERSRGHAPPVCLTAAGELLLAHGASIIEQLDAAQADLRSFVTGERQTLRIGVTQSVATRLLPGALVELRRTHPALIVEIEEASAERLLCSRVAAGDLDLAFGELPLMPGAFEAVVVLEEPCVLLVPASARLPDQRPPTSLADLVRLPLVRLQGWPTLELIERQLAAAGVAADFALKADSDATVQALVGAGCGAAILPRLAFTPGDPSVLAFELGDLLAPRRLALYWHSGCRQRRDVDAFRMAVSHAVSGWATRAMTAARGTA